jgi:hypothetical protein
MDVETLPLLKSIESSKITIELIYRKQCPPRSYTESFKEAGGHKSPRPDPSIDIHQSQSIETDYDQENRAPRTSISAPTSPGEGIL